MRIEVHPRTKKILLTAENCAEEAYLETVAMCLGHGVIQKEPIKFEAVIGRQWGCKDIELPLVEVTP